MDSLNELNKVLEDLKSQHDDEVAKLNASREQQATLIDKLRLESKENKDALERAQKDYAKLLQMHQDSESKIRDLQDHSGNLAEDKKAGILALEKVDLRLNQIQEKHEEEIKSIKAKHADEIVKHQSEMEELVESFALKNVESSEKLHNEELQNKINKERIKELEANLVASTKDIATLEQSIAEKEKLIVESSNKMEKIQNETESLKEKHVADLAENHRRFSEEQKQYQEKIYELENSIDEAKSTYQSDRDKWIITIKRYKENEQAFIQELDKQRRHVDKTSDKGIEVSEDASQHNMHLSDLDTISDTEALVESRKMLIHRIQDIEKKNSKQKAFGKKSHSTFRAMHAQHTSYLQMDNYMRCF